MDVCDCLFSSFWSVNLWRVLASWLLPCPFFCKQTNLQCRKLYEILCLESLLNGVAFYPFGKQQNRGPQFSFPDRSLIDSTHSSTLPPGYCLEKGLLGRWFPWATWGRRAPWFLTHCAACAVTTAALPPRCIESEVGSRVDLHRVGGGVGGIPSI